MKNPQTLLEILPDVLYEQVLEVRVSRPEIIAEEAAARSRRGRLTRSGRLVILAADHPGRGVISNSEDPLSMGNRRNYLSRIVSVLQVDGVDGVMATADILEELLILNHLFRTNGRQPFLEGKLMIGSMNRGGVAGSVFEMMDRFTGLTASQISRMGYDGAKMMFRLDFNNPDSGATIAECAESLRQLDQLGLPAFLEPLAVRREESGYKVIKSAPELIRVIGIATALGNSSRGLWIKIPYVQDYEKTVAATTCPILMLGGDARENPASLLQDFVSGMAAGSNVRGVLVGRNILYPGDGAPSSMARAVAAIVHEGRPFQVAAKILNEDD